MGFDNIGIIIYFKVFNVLWLLNNFEIIILNLCIYKIFDLVRIMCFNSF